MLIVSLPRFTVFIVEPKIRFLFAHHQLHSVGTNPTRGISLPLKLTLPYCTYPDSMSICIYSCPYTAIMNELYFFSEVDQTKKGASRYPKIVGKVFLASYRYNTFCLFWPPYSICTMFAQEVTLIHTNLKLYIGLLGTW